MPRKKKTAGRPVGRPPGSGAKRPEDKAIATAVSFSPELRAWLSTIDPERFTSAARRVLLDAMRHDRKPPPEDGHTPTPPNESA